MEKGYDLHRTFVDAGLPAPRMMLHSEVGGGLDWGGYEYLENTLRSMLPLVIASGVVTAEEVDIDSVAERLGRETIEARGVIKGPDLVSAWTRVSSRGLARSD